MVLSFVRNGTTYLGVPNCEHPLRSKVRGWPGYRRRRDELRRAARQRAIRQTIEGAKARLGVA